MELNEEFLSMALVSSREQVWHGVSSVANFTCTQLGSAESFCFLKIKIA